MPTILAGDITAEIARAITLAGVVAWDTETTGLDWRSDQLALCQLKAPGMEPLLIQVTGDRPPNLSGVLADPCVTKVFHHAPFDLRFMRRAWGADAASVRCTKVASKLLSPGADARTHSLRALTQKYLGKDLEKGNVRTSNWQARELSSDQVAYAVGDVDGLLAIYDRLLVELEHAGLMTLYDDCCTFLPAQTVVTMSGIDDVFAY